MSWTLCTSGAAIAKAGSKANATIVASGATLASFSDEVEGLINAETRYDWVANYSSIGTNYKGALSSVASALIANQIVAYNISGYDTREGETILDVNIDVARKALAFLKDDENKEKMI